MKRFVRWWYLDFMSFSFYKKPDKADIVLGTFMLFLLSLLAFAICAIIIGLILSAPIILPIGLVVGGLLYLLARTAYCMTQEDDDLEKDDM